MRCVQSSPACTRALARALARARVVMLGVAVAARAQASGGSRCLGRARETVHTYGDTQVRTRARPQARVVWTHPYTPHLPPLPKKNTHMLLGEIIFY